jgi:hypothetical protein
MLLERVLARLKEHGALPANEELESAPLEPAPVAAVFPDHFYSTTQFIDLGKGRWPLDRGRTK